MQSVDLVERHMRYVKRFLPQLMDGQYRLVGKMVVYQKIRGDSRIGEDYVDFYGQQAVSGNDDSYDSYPIPLITEQFVLSPNYNQIYDNLKILLPVHNEIKYEEGDRVIITQFDRKTTYRVEIINEMPDLIYELELVISIPKRE